MPGIQGGEFKAFGERGRDDQVVAEADPGMGPAVLPHERRRPPGHPLADLEPLHAAEQAHHLAALRRAHPPAISARLTTAASTLIRSDIGLVFRGDYLASFGLNRIREELEAVTALAGEYQDGELLAVALLEDEAGDKLRAAHS